MNDLKNINTESDFEKRTGLIIWLHSKRNIKRLMNFWCFIMFLKNELCYLVCHYR